MYGPPGTGKTLLARACAAQTDATFLKLAGPQLVQMFIGDGAKLVRDAFALAKEKAPAIIFIDELDAVGTKRFDSEKSGDREVQRTMLELLNQLDGFASDDRIKVLAATNRVDVLDPALLRSGRLDRKIEFPLPNEEARAQIMRIHSRKMTVDDGVNWNELARSTDEFGGAMLKAVCVEAGMIALRMGKNKIGHEHYVDAITEVQAKKKEVRARLSVLRLPSHMRADHFHRLSTSTPRVVRSRQLLQQLFGQVEIDGLIDIPAIDEAAPCVHLSTPAQAVANRFASDTLSAVCKAKYHLTQKPHKRRGVLHVKISALMRPQSFHVTEILP